MPEKVRKTAKPATNLMQNIRSPRPSEINGDALKKLGTQTSILVNLQRLDAHGKPRPWLFVGNRITRCLVCRMVMGLAAAAQESHDFNRGRVSICRHHLPHVA